MFAPLEQETLGYLAPGRILPYFLLRFPGGVPGKDACLSKRDHRAFQKMLLAGPRIYPRIDGFCAFFYIRSREKKNLLGACCAKYVYSFFCLLGFLRLAARRLFFHTREIVIWERLQCGAKLCTLIFFFFFFHLKTDASKTLRRLLMSILIVFEVFESSFSHLIILVGTFIHAWKHDGKRGKYVGIFSLHNKGWANFSLPFPEKGPFLRCKI